MTVDEIVHNRVALMLGDALVRKVAMEAQVEALTKQVAELKAEAETLEKKVADLTPPSAKTVD